MRRQVSELWKYTANGHPYVGCAMMQRQGAPLRKEEQPGSEAMIRIRNKAIGVAANKLNVSCSRQHSRKVIPVDLLETQIYNHRNQSGNAMNTINNRNK